MIDSVLITGGTGSFGRAFAKRLLAMPEPPEKVIIYSRDEHKQEQMAAEFSHPAMRFFIGDVRDLERLQLAMRGVEVVIHAAALKIVPILEYNPIEAIRTNIMGTQNVILAALNCATHRVIAISTDKAVAPTNLYGATKMTAEKLTIAANNLSGQFGPRLSVVRYGNVANSRGSVIPLFKARLEAGLPLQITHMEMTRFWITLDNAVDLVLDAHGAMEGGEIFVPHMPSFRVKDLANALAFGQMHDVTGIRAGEKIHEEMITCHEARLTEQTHRMFVIRPPEYALANMTTGWTNMPEGFSYRSDQNDHWMTVKDLVEFVK
jgi:UDP-N-acetylglucosamine 4,6-dehydratase/5-epimerase